MRDEIDVPPLTASYFDFLVFIGFYKHKGYYNFLTIKNDVPPIKSTNRKTLSSIFWLAARHLETHISISWRIFFYNLEIYSL